MKGKERELEKKSLVEKRNRERIVTSRNRMRKENGLPLKETGE